MKLYRLSWDKFIELTNKLTKKIQTDFKADVLVGVGKSGIVPAAIIAKKLQVERLNLITVQFYNEDKPPKRVFKKPKIIRFNFDNLTGKNVLIIDDFSRTGSTLNEVINIIEKEEVKEIRTAVVVIREDTKFQPDYYGMKIKGCVIFPWDN